MRVVPKDCSLIWLKLGDAVLCLRLSSINELIPDIERRIAQGVSHCLIGSLYPELLQTSKNYTWNDELAAGGVGGMSSTDSAASEAT